eukprot:868463-Rhodomonas_salina.1
MRGREEGPEIVEGGREAYRSRFMTIQRRMSPIIAACTCKPASRHDNRFGVRMASRFFAAIEQPECNMHHLRTEQHRDGSHVCLHVVDVDFPARGLDERPQNPPPARTKPGDEPVHAGLGRVGGLTWSSTCRARGHRVRHCTAAARTGEMRMV